MEQYFNCFLFLIFLNPLALYSFFLFFICPVLSQLVCAQHGEKTDPEEPVRISDDQECAVSIQWDAAHWQQISEENHQEQIRNFGVSVREMSFGKKPLRPN